MPRFLTKYRSLPFLTLAALGACSMPTEPSGVHDEPMTNMAIHMQQQGDDTGAADLYQRELQKKPNDVTAARNLSALLEAHGNYAAAEDFNAQALKYAPTDTDLLHDEGRLLIRLNRMNDARDVYARILRRRPA